MKRIIVALAVLIASGAGAQEYVQKTNAFVPGLYHWRTGQHLKATAVWTLGTAAFGAWAYCFFQDPDALFDKAERLLDTSGDWRKINKTYERAYDARDRKELAPTFAWIAGGVCAVSFLDAIIYRQGMSISARPGGIVLAYSF